MREEGKKKKRKKGKEAQGPSKAELLKKERSWNVKSGRSILSISRRVFLRKKERKRRKRRIRRKGRFVTK